MTDKKPHRSLVDNALTCDNTHSVTDSDRKSVQLVHIKDAHAHVAGEVQKAPGSVTAVTAPVTTPPARRFQHATDEPARLTYCTRCGTPVIRAHTDGLELTCDPTPLTPAGEALALLDRRVTVQLLIRHNGTVELQARSLTHIRAHRDHTILATHRCGQPALTSRQIHALPPSTPFVITPPSPPPAGDKPPF